MMTIKELANLLHKRYCDDCTYVSSIIEDIDDYREIGEVSNVKLEVVTCQKEEIERGLWEYCALDTFDGREYSKNPDEKSGYVVDITLCEDIIEVWLVPNVKDDCPDSDYWERYAWEENNYDRYDD